MALADRGAYGKEAPFVSSSRRRSFAANGARLRGRKNSPNGLSGNAIIQDFQIPITLLGAILMEKSGRRPLLMVSTTGEFLGCFLSGTSFFLNGQSLLIRWDPILAASGVSIFVASFSIGIGAIPWVIMSEIFPIHVMVIAGSLVTLVSWFGTWAVSYTFNFLMSWSSTDTFFVDAAFSWRKWYPKPRGKHWRKFRLPSTHREE